MSVNTPSGGEIIKILKSRKWKTGRDSWETEGNKERNEGLDTKLAESSSKDREKRQDY